MQQDLLEKFVDLGFSINDTKVYLALLKVGHSPIGPIIISTNLHRNIVYTSLSHLINKKLVTEKIIRGSKSFAISSDPEILKEEFSHKLQVASDLVGQIKNQMTIESQEVSVHQGNEEYLELLLSILKAMPIGSKKYILGGGGKEFMENTMKPIWKRYHKVAHERNIQILMIAYEYQRKDLAEDSKKEGIYSVRYLPNSSENPAGNHIYPDLGIVLDIIYSNHENPVTAIKIKDKRLAVGYLNLFNNLWNVAKD